MAKKKITISDMIDRFGRERIVKALTKRRFTNKKRSEMRKTGQKHMGFMSGGFAGLFGKRKNVEAGGPDKKKKKNVIKENVTKKQKRLEELKKELGMARGGIRRKPKKPILPPTGTDPTRPKPKLPPYLKKSIASPISLSEAFVSFLIKSKSMPLFNISTIIIFLSEPLA